MPPGNLHPGSGRPRCRPRKGGCIMTQKTLRRLLRVTVALIFLALAATVRAEGSTEAGAFCDAVKQQAGTIQAAWKMRDLTLFGCLLPSAESAGVSGTFQVKATFWYKGTTVQGEFVKARREIRGLLAPASAGGWKLDKLEYGAVEDLGFFTQLFAWIAWVVSISLIAGVAAAVVGFLLPRGLVNFLAGLFVVSAAWYFGDACFGSTWAAVLCTIAYLVVAGSAAAKTAEA